MITLKGLLLITFLQGKGEIILSREGGIMLGFAGAWLLAQLIEGSGPVPEGLPRQSKPQAI